MPLDKKKLRDNIEETLKKNYENYKDGDEDAIDPSAVTDEIVAHVHNEIENKLADLIEVNIQLAQAVSTGMSAITPPGNGAQGAAVFNARFQRSLAELQSLLADINRYKG